MIAELTDVAEEDRPPIPDTSHLITETDEPVDNIFSEKQMRLLTETLYSSWDPGRDFWIAANVGIYAALNANAIVPDVFIAMDILPKPGEDGSSKCYFFWDYGKAPEIAIEVVSNKVGGEHDRKLERYARLGVAFYVVYDPELEVSKEPLEVYQLTGGSYRKKKGLTFPSIGLGLKIWNGVYENWDKPWLRWTDLEGNLLEFSKEAIAARDSQLAARDARNEALAAKLRELGVDPDSI